MNITDPTVLGLSFIGMFLLFVFVTIRNIHLLKKRKKTIDTQLRQLEQQNLALDQHALVSVANADGKITWVNENFKNVTGFSEEDIIGQQTLTLWKNAELAEGFQEMKESIGKGQAWSGEILTRKQSGEYFRTQTTIVPFFDQDGNLLNTQSVRTDVTTNIEAGAKRQIDSTLHLFEDEISMFWPDTLEFIYMNEACQRGTGWSDGTYLGKSVFDLNLSVDFQKFHKLTKGMETSGSRFVTYRSNWGKRIVEITLQYVTPPDERPRFVSWVRDITQAAHAEREVENLRTVLDLADHEVYIMNSDTLNYVYLNQSALRKVGWSESEYRDKTPASDDKAFSEKIFRERVAPLENSTQSAVQFERKNLHKRPTEVAIQKVEMEGEGPCYVATVRDISERVAAERKQRRFRTALDLSTDAIHMFWPDTHKFIYGNEEAKHRLGATSEEFLEMTPYDTNPNLTREMMQKRVDELINGESKSMVYETNHILADGTQLPVEINLQYIEPEGFRPYILALIRDLTVSKAAEKAKSEFVATVSHELRTPLTSIKGALGLVRTGTMGEIPEKTKPMIEIAYSNCERLVRLINDILDMEKIEAGKMDFKLAQTDITQLLREAYESNKGYGEEMEVSFALDVPDAPVMVNADGDRLQQVMANLMSNAAKFSPKGSVIHVRLNTLDGKTRVLVSDPGTGIPIDAQATIFEKFTQADSSDIRKKGGTGLGLSISKKIVESHNGSLQFKSTPGEGTDFWFDLDLIQPAKTEVTKDRETYFANILICEDEADIAKLFQIAVKAEGISAEIAATASDARALLTKSNFDAMILDIGLPDESGLNLLHELRDSSDLGALPVVIVSGSKLEVEDPAPPNLKAFFRKPPDTEELVAVIKSLALGESDTVPSILHVEDDLSTQEIIVNIVDEIATVESAGTIAEAQEKLRARTYDLLLLDLNLPDGNGAQLLQDLRPDIDKKMPVVVFSGDDKTGLDMDKVDSVMLKSDVTNEEILSEIKSSIKNKTKVSE